MRQPLFDCDRALRRQDLHSVFIDDCAGLGVEDDEAWKSPHFEVLGCRLHTCVFIRQGKPRHFREVLIVKVLVLIARAENHLHDLGTLIGLGVELDEEGSEFATRWTIVHAKVESEQLVFPDFRLTYGRGLATSLLHSVGHEHLVVATEQTQRVRLPAAAAAVLLSGSATTTSKHA